MQLNNLKSSLHQKIKRRVGRGGKRGTFSGRGVKGQKARSGRKLRPEWRDILKSIPKKRGYKFNSRKQQPVILNLRDLKSAFKEGDLITVEALADKKMIPAKKGGKLPAVKILGQGSIFGKFNFRGIGFSKSAREAIVKEGGDIS